MESAIIIETIGFMAAGVVGTFGAFISLSGVICPDILFGFIGR